MEKWIEDLVGIPYVDYGNTPEEGFHCCGLVRYVLNRAFKTELPSDPLLWRKLFRDLPWPCPLQNYDVVLMKGPNEAHIGAVIGTDEVLHAWKPAGGVILMRLERLAPLIEAAGRFKAQ